MTDPIDPSDELGSPLDFAVDQQSRLTMATVRRAVARGDAVLAYQPVVQSGRPQHVAFHEGLIRIIDETGRIVPLRDFLPLAELGELGRQIDCLALALGLRSLSEHREIVEAIASGDADAAEKALRHHISTAFETRLMESARAWASTIEQGRK